MYARNAIVKVKVSVHALGHGGSRCWHKTGFWSNQENGLESQHPRLLHCRRGRLLVCPERVMHMSPLYSTIMSCMSGTIIIINFVMYACHIILIHYYFIINNINSV